MNRHEAFDYVVDHLFKQGHPARDEESCAYRGRNGTMCAVGCLIPDSMYDPEMEGFALDSIIDNYDLPDVIKRNKDLFRQLQSVHDDAELFGYTNSDGTFIRSELYKQLRETARLYNIKSKSLRKYKDSLNV